VKTFLGLSSARAYKRFYPAVDPLISWSRYWDQLRPYFDQHLQPGQRDYPFFDKEEAHRFFTQLTGLLKNLNHSARNAPEYAGYLTQIDELVKTLGRPAGTTPDAQVGHPSGETSTQRPAAAA